MNEEYIPRESLGRAFVREIYDWVEAAVIAVVCVVLVFTFAARLAGVNGRSMNPTLKDRDRLIITRLFYSPHQGDIVVITKPNSQNEPLIKRIIAVGGQTVDIDFELGVVFVDDTVLSEGYIAEPTHRSYEVEFPQTVPEGCVFVMGDNRNMSWDSRAAEVGMVDERYILGKVVYRVLPYNKMGVPQ